jgi:hypothetical protein
VRNVTFSNAKTAIQATWNWYVLLSLLQDALSPFITGAGLGKISRSKTVVLESRSRLEVR